MKSNYRLLVLVWIWVALAGCMSVWGNTAYTF